MCVHRKWKGQAFAEVIVGISVRECYGKLDWGGFQGNVKKDVNNFNLLVYVLVFIYVLFAEILDLYDSEDCSEDSDECGRF